MAIKNKAIPALSTDTPGADFAKYIAIIWKTLVIFGGIATLLYLSLGALEWILSGGNQEKLKKAKDKMSNGVIGLVILALSYAIIKIISSITGLDILNPAWQVLE